MKFFILLVISITISGWVFAQQRIEGTVLSLNDGFPIEGASVTLQGTNLTVATNNKGYFVIRVTASHNAVTLEVNHVGYEAALVPIKFFQKDSLKIFLRTSSRILDEVEVVSTGYQKIPKERATGSFSTVSNELFNQQVGTDVLSRLPAIANSVVMDNSAPGVPQMMVRGLSTIRGPKDPLVVIDNFPYDGDINNVNPNIVQSITILKDAAASSIWGARAANGVIVITTKTGRFNQPIALTFNSNLTVGTKPDLNYIPQMSASDFIDVEQELFKRNFYNSQINSSSHPVLSPVVDLLVKARVGTITQEQAQQQINILKTVDVRDQLNQYMYKPSVKQQYFLSAEGGTERFSWTSSVGYDFNKDNLGSIYERINLRFQNTYHPIKQLSFTTGLNYTQTQNKSGRSGYNDIKMKGGSFVPYMQMVDADGNALSVARDWNKNFIETAGQDLLLDWHYYPLTDWEHQTSNGTVSDLLAIANVNYQIIKGLSASANYQFERQTGLNSNLADDNSYFARNYINSFAQIVNGNATFPVPVGGILDKFNNVLQTSNLRGQLSFDNSWNNHNINAIAGVETRSANINGHQERYYGYNPNDLTTKSVDYTRTYPGFIGSGGSYIQNNQYLNETATRFVSYFANAAYTFNNKYLFSASARRDASNLFGLKTNDQWNPFWSAGFAWNLSNEKFYNIDFLPYLNIRTTYGFSGNIDPSMVAVNTMTFGTNVSTFTGMPMAWFNNYYNPELKWETSKMINIAMDFRTKNGRLRGSVEYYQKKGKNLFGSSPIDYSTGVPPSMLRNVANMKGNGLDIELKSLNIDRSFKWQTMLNFSIYKDKVVDYLTDRTLASQYVTSGSIPISGIEGKPVYAVFAYKWAGLDPNTGEARGYLNGEISKDYRTITGAGTKLNSLEYFGSAIPTKFGSLINTLSYKNVSLQVGVSFKFGYWFRRSSINYTNLYNNWRGHSDYTLRWQKAGDEEHTSVPVNLYTTNAQRDAFYAGSSVLVEKGDHIRLQYINLTYDLKLRKGAGIPIKGLQLYFNTNNLGLLWSANNSGLDPDYAAGTGFKIVTPRNYTLGLRTKF